MDDEGQAAHFFSGLTMSYNVDNNIFTCNRSLS